MFKAGQQSTFSLPLSFPLSLPSSHLHNLHSGDSPPLTLIISMKLQANSMNSNVAEMHSQDPFAFLIFKWQPLNSFFTQLCFEAIKICICQKVPKKKPKQQQNTINPNILKRSCNDVLISCLWCKGKLQSAEDAIVLGFDRTKYDNYSALVCPQRCWHNLKSTFISVQEHSIHLT